MSDSSPKNRNYDYKALIKAYLDANRTSYIHEDFKKYYAGLFETLQKAFGLDFKDHSKNRDALVMLFWSTVSSYENIRSPWSNYLEGGLIIRKLEQAGEGGEIVLTLSKKIEELHKKSKKAHWEMLDSLFQLIFGRVSKVVTSKELLELGFDDSKEPDFTDYY